MQIYHIVVASAITLLSGCSAPSLIISNEEMASLAESSTFDFAGILESQVTEYSIVDGEFVVTLTPDNKKCLRRYIALLERREDVLISNMLFANCTMDCTEKTIPYVRHDLVVTKQGDQRAMDLSRPFDRIEVNAKHPQARNARNQELFRAYTWFPPAARGQDIVVYPNIDIQHELSELRQTRNIKQHISDLLNKSDNSPLP